VVGWFTQGSIVRLNMHNVYGAFLHVVNVLSFGHCSRPLEQTSSLGSLTLRAIKGTCWGECSKTPLDPNREPNGKFLVSWANLSWIW